MKIKKSLHQILLKSTECPANKMVYSFSADPKLSPEKAIDIFKTIYQVSFETPFSNKVYKKLLLKNQEQKDIINLFNLGD